ncbi:MAG: hypothetical protein ACI936_001720 [Paraglaciecola sp.]|jgi:hypothetical protein
MISVKSVAIIAVVSILVTIPVYSQNSSLSSEQQNMVSGFVRGTGCVNVKDRSSISRIDKLKALLRAKATLATEHEVSGTEQAVTSDVSETYSATINSQAKGVINQQPKQELFFSDTSMGYFCVII